MTVFATIGIRIVTIGKEHNFYIENFFQEQIDTTNGSLDSGCITSVEYGYIFRVWTDETNVELASRLADERAAVCQRAPDELRRPAGADAAPDADIKSDIESTAFAALMTDILHVYREPSTTAIGHRNLIWAIAPMTGDGVWPVLLAGLNAAESEVRQAAWHVVSVRRQAQAADLLNQRLGLQDEVAAVQRAAAEAAGRIGNANTIPVLLECLETVGDDRFLEHSLLYALIELNHPSVLRDGLPNDTPMRRRGRLIVLDQLANGQLAANDVLSVLTHEDARLRSTARWIFERHPEWLPQLTPLIRAEQQQLIHDSPVTRELSQLVVVSANRVPSQDALAQLLETQYDAATQDFVQDALTSSQPQAISPTLQQAIAKLLASGEAEQTGWMEVLASIPASLDDDKLVALLLQKVRSSDAAAADRRLAMSALRGKAPTVPDDLFVSLVRDLESSTEHQVRRAAAVTLASAPLSRGQRDTLVTLLPKIGTVELPTLLPAFRATGESANGSSAWQALQQNPSWVVVPAEAIREAFSGYDASLRARIDASLEGRTLADADQAARLTELLTQLPSGDIRRGQAVFHSAKAACFSCHALGYRGGDAGPDLTRIGAVRSRRDLLESIAFPNASFVRSFEPVSIVTTRGVVLQGVIKDENTQRIKLVDAQRQILEFSRSDIEELQPSEVSIMPSGLDRLLDRQELADLLEFLLNAK